MITAILGAATLAAALPIPQALGPLPLAVGAQTPLSLDSPVQFTAASSSLAAPPPRVLAPFTVAAPALLVLYPPRMAVVSAVSPPAGRPPLNIAPPEPLTLDPTPVAVAVANLALPAADGAIDDGDLQSARGGAVPSVLSGVPLVADSALSFQSLSGQVAGNSVTAQTVDSGAIDFNGQALSGYNGIGNFILNTGMNSLLQGSINVTVNLVGGK